MFGNRRNENKEITIIEQTDIIIIEGEHYRRSDPDEEEDKRFLKIIAELTKIIDKLVNPPKPTRILLVLTKNFSNNKTIIMSLSIAANQFSLGTLGLVDAALQPIDATFSNQSFTSSDSAVFTAEPDASDPNVVKVSGVGAGDASLSFSATATYTDANTGQQVSKAVTGTTSVSVTAVVGEQDVSLVVNFGDPQNQ